MVQLEGKYQHYKSENLDKYFQAVGVPYIPRKMMCASNPTVRFSKSEDGKWTMTTETVFRTISYTFTLGEEYEETMPGATLKSTTTLEDDTFVTVCVAPNGRVSTRTYVINDEGLVITYLDKETGIQAVRHYKRV